MTLTIAIDYDGTYTAAPEMWSTFIEDAQRRGHRVIMVTCRRDTEENREDCRIPGILWNSHYFTNLSSKKWFLDQRGVKVDIWIDDEPETVEKGK